MGPLKFVSLLASMLLLLTTPASAARAERPAGLDDQMRRILAETQVPSMSVARIERRRIAWSGAWGLRGPGSRANSRTLYNVASLTKPVSAETVLRAASAGRLSLDEPMANFWVDPDLASEPRVRLLTARLALTHRTGFPNWRAERGLAFERDPGDEVGYSGEGFEYMARYAQRRSRTPFERLAQSLVFEPAGMRSTSYTHRAWFQGRVATPADAEGNWLAPAVREQFIASDDLHTTATDYARFLISVVRGTGLTSALRNERTRIHASTRAGACTPARVQFCPDEAGWGLGWDVAVFGDRRILWHTGADRGEFSFAYIIPSTGEGAVVLTNSAAGHRVMLPVFEAIGMEPRFLAWLRALAGS